MTKAKPTAEKRVAEAQGGSPSKRTRSNDVGANETDSNSTLSNVSTLSDETAVKSPPPSPSKAVVNFAETGVQLPVGVTILQGVGSAVIDVSSGVRGPVPVISMRSHCPGNLTKIKRILNLYILMPSYGRLHNIYTADPKDFQLNPVGRDPTKPKGWHIGNCHSESKTVSFYITGRVVKSVLSVSDETKSISIVTIERFWPRVAAFLATTINVDVLCVPVKDGGVSH
ncbi:uncharacterized protein EV420DRAFT_1653477 [Desarmillaria tabescens]|uniref:Uncharacterized protein n=1 Tax=Armillaria tabescens TaxID=1929756 RepID=A0AA39J2X3_ARMTA|nr:uncharacterized protein EV420DRAFT_1653477 [Desarmillaria tabescens]KAK0435098.1 hypothetical protein EV420DRAFT_1653477 [Desarmillaria tabescens]